MIAPSTQAEQSIICGDCVEVMAAMPEASVDCIITDSPYGLEFMGAKWDKLGRINSGRSREENEITAISRGPERYEAGLQAQLWHTRWAAEALRVAKPGAMLAAFGGTRTWHRLACALEDAGWQLRDTVCWIYGSGFPKSLDISKAIDKRAGAEREVYLRVPRKVREGESKIAQADKASEFKYSHPATPAAKLWHGWGTALKPAWEPVLLAMKPLDGSFVENALKHGVAGLAIDAGRVEAGQDYGETERFNRHSTFGLMGKRESRPFKPAQGRWPANVLHDGSEEVLAEFPAAKSGVCQVCNGAGCDECDGTGRWQTGSAARFFYCAKASRAERNAGLEGMEAKDVPAYRMNNGHIGSDGSRRTQNKPAQNNHPTVKPIALMEYLCKLLSTPTGGLVLDPFAGSGSTGVACKRLGRPFIGIELDKEYCEIARRRIAAVQADRQEKLQEVMQNS